MDRPVQRRSLNLIYGIKQKKIEMKETIKEMQKKEMCSFRDQNHCITPSVNKIISKYACRLKKKRI